MKNIAVGLFIIAIFSCTKTVYVDVEKEIVKQILITEYVTPVNDFNPVYPVKVQSFVTSNFGYRKTIANTGGNAGGDIFHTGIDIGVAKTFKESVQVVAVEEGIAVDVWHSPKEKTKNGYYKGHQVYGGMVRILHKNGYVTLYGHLDYVLVNENQKIKQGEVIGYMGNTGVSSGKHLHFSIEIDPKNILNKEDMKQKQNTIALLDVDGHNFPNIPLMKISAWHKVRGDIVEWYNPLFSSGIDKLYMSKIFTFTPDYKEILNAKEIIKGGTAYNNNVLPEDIEHIYPDYSLYNITETAYGFLTRGCPRKCEFCIVSEKEGIKAQKVSDLSEFWNGQKNIELLDPNLLACRESESLLMQLSDSGAWVNFNQGLDARLLTDSIIEHLLKIKIRFVHFALDDYKNMNLILEKIKIFKKESGFDCRKIGVYVLCNFNTCFEQDLERIYKLREIEVNPYVMIFEKEKLPAKHKILRLQRWVNNRFIFKKCRTFEDYI